MIVTNSNDIQKQNKPEYIVMDNYITPMSFPNSYLKKIENYKRQSYASVNDLPNSRITKSMRRSLAFLTKNNTPMAQNSEKNVDDSASEQRNVRNEDYFFRNRYHNITDTEVNRTS